MKKTKLPEILYMAWNNDMDEPFLDHTEEANLLAEINATREVGQYKLVKKLRLVNKTTAE